MTQAAKPLDIDAIEARANAATPGPWEAIDQKREHHEFKFVRSKTAIHKNDRGPSYAYEILSDEDYDTKSADMQFIAHARTDIPDLIAAYRSQAAEIARLREQLAAARSVTDEKVQKARSAYNANFTAIIPDGDPAMRAALKAAMEKKV